MKQAGSSGPGWRTLKRRMKAVLESLEWAASEGRAPLPGDLGDFTADARAMAGHPGLDGPALADFLAAVEELSRACAARDPAAMGRALASIRASRDAGHARR